MVVAREGASDAPETLNEDRHIQYQQHQQKPPNLLTWLGSSKPGVACLQELKTADRDFPKKAMDRWRRDARLRIDHLLLSREASKRLVASGVDRPVRGEGNASDHAPVWIELRDAAPAKRRSRAARVAPAVAERETRPPKSPGRRPLLVIDGNSFAHRAYHALPKNIRRKGNRPAGAIVGFANLLLRFYREERPRAILVGWDTYEEPTYRHEAFAAYQGGRQFDDEVLEQLGIIPTLVAACGFANAKRAGYEADDFLAAAAAAEERRGGTVLVASGDRDTFQPRLGKDNNLISDPRWWGGAHRPGGGPRALRR